MVVAFCISVFSSTGGVSGAFLLLPFQMSFLGFTSPAVSPTNLIYNIFAIPSGVYRYAKEKRLVIPIVITSLVGTVPGVLIGIIVRIKFLPDPRYFKLFVGLVLLYLGIRLASGLFPKKTPKPVSKEGKFEVSILRFNLKEISYSFEDKTYSISTLILFILCLVIGIIGGMYGIGGGAILAPILVSSFGLPVYTIAGAALLGTFATSVVGVIFYAVIALFYNSTAMPMSPDWLLGVMFGIGGAAGIYIGARLQRFMPERFIKGVLTVVILIVVYKYTSQFFTN